MCIFQWCIPIFKHVFSIFIIEIPLIRHFVFGESRVTPFESIETIGHSPQRAAFVLGLLVYPAGDALDLPLVWGVFF